MNNQYVEPFTVAGQEERTTNAREASGNGVIGKLWGLYGHNLPGAPIAVYSDLKAQGRRIQLSAGNANERRRFRRIG